MSALPVQSYFRTPDGQGSPRSPQIGPRLGETEALEGQFCRAWPVRQHGRCAVLPGVDVLRLGRSERPVRDSDALAGDDLLAEAQAAVQIVATTVAVVTQIDRPGVHGTQRGGRHTLAGDEGELQPVRRRRAVLLLDRAVDLLEHARMEARPLHVDVVLARLSVQLEDLLLGDRAGLDLHLQRLLAPDDREELFGRREVRRLLAQLFQAVLPDRLPRDSLVVVGHPAMVLRHVQIRFQNRNARIRQRNPERRLRILTKTRRPRPVPPDLGSSLRRSRRRGDRRLGGRRRLGCRRRRR